MNPQPETAAASPSLRERLMSHLVQTIPVEIARCEFNCSVGECSYEEWQRCSRRQLGPSTLPDEK
jgi:hypothetical protein